MPVEDVPAWPVAEIFPRGIPAELDEGGIHFCTMLTVQEIGPLEDHRVRLFSHNVQSEPAAGPSLRGDFLSFRINLINVLQIKYRTKHQVRMRLLEHRLNKRPKKQQDNNILDLKTLLSGVQFLNALA